MLGEDAGKMPTLERTGNRLISTASEHEARLKRIAEYSPYQIRRMGIRTLTSFVSRLLLVLFDRLP